MSLLNSQLEQLIENARRIKTPEFVKTIEDYSDLFKHHSFRLRPSVNSISLVSCSSVTPQLGFSGITNEKALRSKLNDLQQGKITLLPPDRKTPEKALQSWLISQALADGQKLASIDAVLNDGHSYRFVTDEISLRVSDASQTATNGNRVVADLLLIRTNDQGESEIVNAELKSQRSTETFKQIDDFWKFMGEDQRKRWREFIGTMLGDSELRWKDVNAPCGIVIWPAPLGASSQQTRELVNARKKDGIETICYTGPLYEFETERS
jgi:hypothetical protein